MLLHTKMCLFENKILSLPCYFPFMASMFVPPSYVCSHYSCNRARTFYAVTGHNSEPVTSTFPSTQYTSQRSILMSLIILSLPFWFYTAVLKPLSHQTVVCITCLPHPNHILIPAHFNHLNFTFLIQ
jgi:hypothetical protein